VIACPRCRTIQPVDHLNTGRALPCPGCCAAVRADVFNAFLRADDPAAGYDTAQAPGQAECFYHPGKAAIVPCGACGRLLCAVCRVDLDGRTLCMRCLQAGRDKQRITTLQNRRTLYDSLALNLAFWPMTMIFPTLLTAPAAIYYAVRHFRAPDHILPRTHLKSILAMLLASGQIVAWIVFAFYQWGRWV